MAIKSGKILVVDDGYLVERVQTAGPTSLNIPEANVFELGNTEIAGYTRDRPDLSFDLETTDFTLALEALLTGADPTAIVAGTGFDLVGNGRPQNIISPFIAEGASTGTVGGVALPYLVLEQLAYRFGIRQNATKTATLRGDSIYYGNYTPYISKYTAAAPVAGPYAFAHTALPTNELGTDVFAVGVTVLHAAGGFERLFIGSDFTNTNAAITLTVAGAAKVAVGDTIEIVYMSATPATYPQSIHSDTTAKPAAVRHPDLDLYLGPQGGTLVRYRSVQGWDGNWRVNLDADEEFGNVHAVAQDYIDPPEASGTFTLRPQTAAAFMAAVNEVTGTAAGYVANPTQRVPLEMELRVSHPTTHAVIETLYVPDAIIQPPPVQPRVSQKLEPQFTWRSASGQLIPYAGIRP